MHKLLIKVVTTSCNLRLYTKRRLQLALTNNLHLIFSWIIAPKILITIIITLFIATFLAPNMALAIEDSPPDDQKTYLKADSAKCSRQNNENICIYKGNVKLNKGTTALQAEQIAIYKIANGQINKIVASGKNSHYNGVMEDNARPFNADADNIIITPEHNTMTLLGRAQIITEPDKNDHSQKLTKAYADKVMIYSKQGMMNLRGNAQVIIGQDKYSGPYIDYQFKQMSSCL